MSLSRFLPFFSGFDPDRPTRSAQRGAILLGRKLRPTDPLGSDLGRRVHFQLRTPHAAASVLRGNQLRWGARPRTKTQLATVRENELLIVTHNKTWRRR